jgi:stage II sporulation protein D
LTPPRRSLGTRLRRRAGHALAASVAVGLAVSGSCASAPRARSGGPRLPEVQAATAQRPAAAESPLPGVSPPVIRVGLLVEVSRVSVSADSGVTIRAIAGADQPTVFLPPQRDVVRATFVAAGQATSRFRVQAASMADADGAREAAERAEAASGLKAIIRWNPDTKTHQVRLGDFARREDAQAYTERLPGSIVVEEYAASGSGRIRLLETGEEYAAALLFPAAAGEFLDADGSPYRGVLEVRAANDGTLTVVNALNLEDYVRGVVPNELSPYTFPQLEALKAQAVAARTYALRNRGGYSSQGYDICATPACQVYRGKGTEHPLTDRAVEETRGIVAYYDGALINALFTSTCGGHTEDGESVFDGPVQPYLRGVACLPEREAWTTLRTAQRPRELAATGLARDAALLVALGILDAGQDTPAGLEGFASEQDVDRWTARLLEAAHRQACDSTVSPPRTYRGAFFRHVVDSLCWGERAERLLTAADPPYLLQIEDRADLQENEKRPAALLIQEGVLSPLPNNTLRPRAPITRAGAVALLAQAVARAGAPALQTGEFRSAAQGQLTVAVGEQAQSYPLDPGLRLFRALDGTSLGASELTLVAGETVRFVLDEGRVTFLEAEQSRLGPSADHASRYYRWEVRMTPDEVARSISRYGSVGTVRDILPRRMGVSGRVIEAAVTGTSGELDLRGLQVRWGLGLRENLFVIDRELDAAGHVRRFTFTGKGWGHGVGLCQVGASGMAQAGATYDRILRHYYRGITLAQAN